MLRRKLQAELENKIKRIEDILEQLEYERDISIAYNKEGDVIRAYGEIVGLKVALAILKDEI